MAGRDDDRRLKATPRKLRKARQRGEVARSRDVVAAATLLAAIAISVFGLAWAIAGVQALLDRALSATSHPSPTAMIELGAASGATFIQVALGFLFPVAFAGAAAAFLYVGPVLSFEPLAFRLDRLNPAQSFGRLFDRDNLINLALNCAKALLFVFVAGGILVHGLLGVGDLPGQGPSTLLATLGGMVLKVFLAAGAVAVIVGAADGIYRRFQYVRSQRMTHDERRRDRREATGDPRLRRQRRRLHQEWARKSATESARKAVVLVTNPTHLSIALAYDPLEHAAPVVSAKGEDLVAAAMREEAEGAGVPIMRNVALARALYERTEVEDTVPEDLFTAVAEVILWARRLREQTSDTESPDR